MEGAKSEVSDVYGGVALLTQRDQDKSVCQRAQEEARRETSASL